MRERFSHPPIVGIIGGLGRMGQWFARHLSAAGGTVRIADQRLGTVTRAFVAQSEVLLLAVPLSAIEGLLQKIGPWTREDGVVVDITSLKEQPVRWMLDRCRGEVVGGHPLFGPTAESFQDQVVFLWPARSELWYGRLRGFLEGCGARVTEMRPAEHDRLMACVQVLRYLALLCFGRALMRVDLDLDATLPISGPWFQTLVDMLARQAGQSPAMYADLVLQNPWTPQVIEAFTQSVVGIAQASKEGRADVLIREIQCLSSYLAGQDPKDPPRTVAQ